ncbi:alpha-L-rhamnosidase [Chitinophaga japonensis]|uniref:alpha-L-rhamnosidase n=1 Tax=Chitinophaga japonensis TaxID=104662 RepID=A0A562T4I5_CHIJA|nr:alpha-L-rhamnosidase [Chitinophaga japonensis]TWI88283.1 alpha-L-rhamnosidase [Chitinophaga japonensis]
MRYFFIAILTIAFPLLHVRTGLAQEITVQHLRCEMLVNPRGIDVRTPRLSWEISGAQRHILQTAYQVLVASSPGKLAAGEGDLWNSGKVSSGQSIHVVYAGAPLRSRVACYWKVRTWTTQGASAWSEPAQWSMGLLQPADWQAAWIGLDRAFPWDSAHSKFSRLSARYFRKTFALSAPIRKATVYLAGLGLHELYMNGQRIGNRVLSPAPTDYTRAVKYNTYDVTHALQQGQNAMGAILGNGRYFTMRQNYKPHKIRTFGYPKMLLQLEIEYADGRRQTIASDDTWKVTADGPIRSNNEYDGEEYDATREMPGWNNTGFDDSHWLQPERVQPPGGRVEAQLNEPMRVMQTLRPVAIHKLHPGVHILDMGQNMVGWLQLKVKGKRGQKITLRFAETLQPDGSLFTANLRDAKVTDVYTLKGEGVETWHPRFVYHGFRYVEVSGYTEPPSLDDFEGQVVYDDIATTGAFETSDSTLNQVYRNAYQGIRGNYKGMPVDCPQRNERMPWLGDRTTGAYGESFVFDNAKLYAKWLDDIAQAQTPEGAIPDVAPAYWRYYSDNMTWPGAFILIADMLYTQFGDQRPIAKHYDDMKRWLAYMRGKYMKDFILTKDKYGDWCVPPESLQMIHSRDSTRRTDGTLLATAYYYRLLQVMERFAGLLQRPEDAAAFADLSGKIKTAFNKKFLHAAEAYYSNNTITANLLPLYFDMVPAEKREAVFENMVHRILYTYKGHISTGVIGTQWLMRGLSREGRPDVAFRLASNRDYPSWGYMVEQGATTIWELWNGDKAAPNMNSHNHVMLLGDLLVWMYEDLAGIHSDAAHPGFKRLIMKPVLPQGLHFVKAGYRTMHGAVHSEWRKADGRFTWKISVPGNTTAQVYVAAVSPAQVMESGKPALQAKGVKFLRMEGYNAVFEIGSGDYVFETTWPEIRKR